MNNELIKVTVKDDKQLVSARELHEGMEVKSQFTHWFNLMKKYGFIEGVDFIAVSQKKLTAQGNTSEYKDYAVTVDMAKQLAMLQRNDKGKAYRQYFIALEKQWNDPKTVMARALQITSKQLEQANKVIEIQKPKVEFYDNVANQHHNLNFRDTAKAVGQQQNQFIGWLLIHNYIYRDMHGSLKPKSQYNKKYFEIKITYSGYPQTLITPKGIKHFNHLLNRGN